MCFLTYEANVFLSKIQGPGCSKHPVRSQGTEESSLSAIQNIYDVGSDLVSVRDPAPSCDSICLQIVPSWDIRRTQCLWALRYVTRDQQRPETSLFFFSALRASSESFAFRKKSSPFGRRFNSPQVTIVEYDITRRSVNMKALGHVRLQDRFRRSFCMVDSLNCGQT